MITRRSLGKKLLALPMAALLPAKAAIEKVSVHASEISKIFISKHWSILTPLGTPLNEMRFRLDVEAWITPRDSRYEHSIWLHDLCTTSFDGDPLSDAAPIVCALVRVLLSQNQLKTCELLVPQAEKEAFESCWDWRYGSLKGYHDVINKGHRYSPDEQYLGRV